jgi:hypothetical protein
MLALVVFDIHGEWGLPHDVARSLERLYRGGDPAHAIQQVAT